MLLFFVFFVYFYRSDQGDNSSEHSGHMDAELDSDQEQDLDKILGSWLGELETMTQVRHLHQTSIICQTRDKIIEPSSLSFFTRMPHTHDFFIHLY